jgi:hypothetical protein
VNILRYSPECVEEGFSEVRPEKPGHMSHILALLPSLCCDRYVAQLTPREGAGQLPALLLDLGPPPNELRVTKQEHFAACAAGGKENPSCRW